MRNFKKAQASRPRSQGHRAPGGSGEPPEGWELEGTLGGPTEDGSESPLPKAMRSGIKS